MPFQTASLSRGDMRVGVAQGRMITPVLFSLYDNEISSLSHHVDLALHVDETAIKATSRKPTLLVSSLESYLNVLQRWSYEWWMTINVSKSTAIIFVRAGRRFTQPRPLILFGEPIQVSTHLVIWGDPRYTTHLVA